MGTNTMTNRAQKIWDAYYHKLLHSEDVTCEDAVAVAIREAVNQVFKEEMIPSAALEEFETICKELEELGK